METWKIHIICEGLNILEIKFKDFLISDDKEKLQLDKVCQLLNDTYWAKDRPREIIEKSIANAICFGIYLDDKQIGFARCVTDFATVYWLADVVIDNDYRKLSLGKALVDTVVKHEQLKGCIGILGTQDAHDLYKKFGFNLVTDRFMRKSAE